MSFLTANCRRFLGWLLRIAVTAICLAILWHLVDIEHIKSAIARCQWSYLAAAAFCYLLGSLGGGFVWLYLLRCIGEKRLSFWRTMRLTLIGFVFNNLVPGGVAGDLYRVIGASRCNIAPARSAATVVLERWTSLLALLVATISADIWALPLLRSASLDHSWAPSWISPLFFRFDIFMSLVLLAVTAGLLLLSYSILRAVRRHDEAPQRLQEEANRLGASWHEFLNELSFFDGRYRQLGLATLLNTSSPFLEGLSFALVAQALGLDLSPFLFLAFTPIFRIISHLPIAVNAIGPQEFITLLLWEPLGATYSDAITISLIIHALKILLSFMGLPLLLVPINNEPLSQGNEQAPDAQSDDAELPSERI